MRKMTCEVYLSTSLTFNLYEYTRLSGSAHRERKSLLCGDGGAALEELHYDFTSRLQTYRRTADRVPARTLRQ